MLLETIDEYVAVTGNWPPSFAKFGDLLSIILRYHRNMRQYFGLIIQVASAFGGSKFDLESFIDGRHKYDDECDIQVGVDALAKALGSISGAIKNANKH